METHANNKSTTTTSSSDCQAAATDSAPVVVAVNAAVEQYREETTSAANEQIIYANEVVTVQEQQQQRTQHEAQKVTNAKNNNNNNNNNNCSSNNNGNNKLKQQQQYHQFRAPQQFVKHKKSTNTSGNCALSNNNNNNNNNNNTNNNNNSNSNKKGKSWNKRQHKNSAKQQQQQQQQQQQRDLVVPPTTNVANSTAEGVANVCNLSSGQATVGVLSSTKADLENSQNLKNQLSSAGGSHHHHYNYYHNHHQQQQQHVGTVNMGVEGRTVGNGLPSTLGTLLNSEKLGYGHGHMKQQQLYKKILTHRGHHHHVLCAAYSNNVNVNGIKNCCLTNNQNGKDAKESGVNNTNIKCMTNVRHICCARAKFFLPEKRPRKEIIPPTKFLLGGNISDPLNLNSLQNETSVSNNNTPATTPRRSPITTPPKVEVIIPPNIRDPLHLLDPVDSMEYEKQLTSPMKRGNGLRGGGLLPSHFNKHRHRKPRKTKRRRHESHNSSISGSILPITASDDTCSLNNSFATTASAEISSIQLDSCSSNATTTADYSEERKENITDAHSTDIVLRENVEGNKVIIHSPQTAEVVKLSSNTVQQHAAGDMLLQHDGVKRTDLSLDLQSISNSTCDSILGGNANSRGGGRKRRISESNASLKNKKFYRIDRNDSMDKIVSPVVPQPGAWKRIPHLATGARKPARQRTTSTSETELLSPAEETIKPLFSEDAMHVYDVNKLEVNKSGSGSPLSTTSGTTSVAAGEQEASIADSESTAIVVGDEKNITTVTTSTTTAVVKLAAGIAKLPKFRADGHKYRHGNYERYAGLRNLNGFMDVRLQVFQRYVELFQGKDILDIGCNVGHMTISLARNLAPKSILGIDIDVQLITQARRNLSLFVRIPVKLINQAAANDKLLEMKKEEKKKRTRRKQRGGKERTQQQQLHHNLIRHHHHHHAIPFMPQGLFCCENTPDPKELRVASKEFFPISFPLTYGGIPAAPPPAATVVTKTPTNVDSNTNNNNINAATTNTTTIKSTAKNTFPNNVYFQQCNYVLKNEALLTNDTQQYDMILCLSVTKWIHLNFGDAGLKLAFKRMFNQLRPGGKLILEAQNWASYKKKKNLTEDIYNNYKNIEFFPNKFHEYLLSSEVGFSHSYTLGVPRHMSKGFCRPIQLYAKGDYTPNHARWSDAHYPQTPYEAYRGIYATMPARPAGLLTSVSSSRSQAYDTPHYTGASTGPYSSRQTPMHQPTSQYYNPLETDSYQPSYDMEYLNHMYVFASPLYQTVWSPPASRRKSSSHTPLFGSVRDAELDGENSGGGGSGGYYPRHVYPPNEDTSSPNANLCGAFNSIHEVDTDDSNQPPGGDVRHVYATTHCGESSSSPQVNHHETEINDVVIIPDEDVVISRNPSAYCDLTEN